ncbi:MAG: RHS domain-containing protein [Rhodocyclaceae bacterium]|nr:RHS domain-containing protein [Rhodocyclaceae bacterium]
MSRNALPGTKMKIALAKLARVLLWLAALLLVRPALAGETVTFFHNDVLGSPLMATDASGSVVWKEKYRPYGERLDNPPAEATNKIGYAGKPYDTNTGLSYFGARYYDPVVGRFTGIDPVGPVAENIHSLNRYTYANNNSYKFIDPDGRDPIAWTVKLLENGGRRLVRAIFNKADAVAARKAEENVQANTRQLAKQIETASNDGKEVVRHKGHDLQNGESGLPHYQTDGRRGHTFWLF